MHMTNMTLIFVIFITSCAVNLIGKKTRNKSDLNYSSTFHRAGLECFYFCFHLRQCFDSVFFSAPRAPGHFSTAQQGTQHSLSGILNTYGITWHVNKKEWVSSLGPSFMARNKPFSKAFDQPDFWCQEFLDLLPWTARSCRVSDRLGMMCCRLAAWRSRTSLGFW